MENQFVYVGARMQVARHFLGKKRPEIAKALGVTSKTYATYESGNAAVLGKLDEIARALCVSTDFLTKGPIKLIPASGLSYRRKVAFKSPEAMHVQALASVATEFKNLIERFVELPSVNVPFTPIKSIEDVEDAVMSIREHLQLSDAPLRNTLSLVESFGILVFWVHSHDSFDGVSFWNEGRPYILLNRDMNDGYRARFTVLHELGHLACHRTAEDADRYEDERRRVDTEANAFASAFLMPATSFAKRYPRYGRLDDIMDERSYWMASCAAMVYRARKLHLIDEDNYRRLNVGISARGWRKREPGAMPPEKSRVHQFFLDEAGDHGLTTLKLADELSCPGGWLMEGFPLAQKYQTHVSIDLP